ncbi:hypothetical protein [Pseudohongiella nitratireducens]|uniref:hypothetical protein n=1 Tax=Pseudohongiella nitratireducens TaxID=1768907 RepID=UPI002956DB9C|nr:hypothetical protein [Pseudohongiella nitratireducens]
MSKHIARRSCCNSVITVSIQRQNEKTPDRLAFSVVGAWMHANYLQAHSNMMA